MVGNPSPTSMKDTLGADDRHNHGFETYDARAGQKIIEPYGLDRSTMAGSAGDERHTHRGMGGSLTNVSHSLKGTSANLTGRSKG